jgi:hypothetical protein
MANEFVIKNGFHSKGDSQVTGSLNVSAGITGSLLGSSSYALTASYVDPTFISASAAASGFGAGGGSGTGFPFSGSAVITGSLLVSQSGLFVTGTFSTNQDAVVNSIDIGLGLGSSNTNLRLGTDALDNTIPGTVGGYDVGRYNSAIGYQALQNNKSGSFNTAIGYRALNLVGSGSFDKVANYLQLDATNNTAIGYFAAYSLESGSRNVAIGTNALYDNKNAGSNIAIGYNSMRYYGQNRSFTLAESQRKNIAIGENSLQGVNGGTNSSENNIAVGTNALQYCTTGRYNVGIGTNTLTGNPLTGDNNAAIGNAALQSNTSGFDNTAIGSFALSSNTTGQQNVAIGPDALRSKTSTQSSIIAIGASSGRTYNGASSVLIGIEAARYATGSDAIVIGSNAGRYVTRITDSIAIGSYALDGMPTGTANVNAHNNNIAIGKEAMRYWISQSNSTVIGPLAMQGRSAFPVGYEATATTQTANNVAIGLSSMQYATRAANNTTIGFNALQALDATYGPATASILSTNVSIGAYSTQRMLFGEQNISIGGSALRYMSSGSRNIGIGAQTLQGSNPGDSIRSTFSTIENTAIGNQAMYLARSGSYNVAIGAQSAYSAANIQYSVYIGTNAGYSRTNGEQNVVIGYGAQRFGSSGSFNTVIGTEASAQGLSSGNRGVLIGYRTGYKLWSVTTSSVDINSVVIGNEAMGDTQFSALGTYVGLSNTVIGDRALYNNRAGSYNVVAGTNVMYGNTNGNYNTTFGHNAMTSSTAADNTVSVGAFSLKNITTGDNNVAIGYQAGEFLNTTSANNVIIGPNAGPSALTTLSNKLYIANAAGNPLIGGDFANKTVTISGSLYISGSIIPSVDATLTSSFELGSPTAAWNRIWVRSSSIHFVDDSGNELAKISATPAGAIELPNIYTSGTFTAQTFVTQSTTYIVEEYFATGSNIFGSSSLDTHQFTGSVLVSGAFYISDVQQAVGSNVLTYNTSNGRLYYTASSALIGPQGPSGASAYDAWIGLGNSGTEQDFVDSIKGATGETGPIGPTGPVGATGPTGEAGEPGLTITDLFVNLSESLWSTTSSIQFSGSVDSLYGYTGSLFGTAATASYIDPIFISSSAASYGFGTGGGSTDISALNAFTESIQTQVNNLTIATSSYVLNSVTSSMSVLSSSYALTASYALNVPTVDTSALVSTASFNSFTSSIQGQVDNLTSATSSYVLNSATGSMLAPYVLTSSTSSMTVLSSSFANTASFVNRLVQNVIVTGSITATSFTGSLRGHVVTSSIDTANYSLVSSDAAKSIDWDVRALIDSSTTAVVDWENKQLLDAWGNAALDWSSAEYWNVLQKYNRQDLSFAVQEGLSSTIIQFSGQSIEGKVPPTAGRLCYLETDGQWYEVDQTTDTSTKMLGITLPGKRALLEGDIALNSIIDPDYGLPVYVREGTSVGALTTIIPTSGYVRVVGHCYYNNASTPGQWILKFRPSNDWFRI